MQYEGVLTKMQTEQGTPIQYYLVFENSFLNMNQLLGRDLEINFQGFKCLNCGKKKKIYRTGFCYDCFYSITDAGDWIMRPELSTAHLGIADRDLEYEKKVQLQPHIVYLASASDRKLGVTRKTQVPTRWIDQGASEAIILAETPNRYLAGVIEVALKSEFTDKTNWRKMLLNHIDESIDLEEIKWRLEELLPSDIVEYFSEEDDVTTIDYPVLEYPIKITSLNLDKSPEIKGRLLGIKGQYFLLDSGRVINIRRHTSYKVKFQIEE